MLDIERGQLEKLRPMFWQTDTSVGEKSWGYIEGERFRTPDSLVDELVDIVSKNGTLLLNIGPTAGRHHSGAGAEHSAGHRDNGCR